MLDCSLCIWKFPPLSHLVCLVYEPPEFLFVCGLLSEKQMKGEKSNPRWEGLRHFEQRGGSDGYDFFGEVRDAGGLGENRALPHGGKVESRGV